MFWGRSRMGKGFAAACRCGIRSEQNKDIFFFVEFAGRDFVLGVMDGHGPGGHRYSEFISSQLPLLLIRSPHFPGNVPEALTRVFEDLSSRLREWHEDLPTDAREQSGATCVIVVRLGCTIYAANLGESRAVLYDAVSSQVLSRDIRQESPSEKACRSRQGLHRALTPKSLGTGNATSQGFVEYLAKSHRSFGAPDLKIYPLDPMSSYVLVVGSDGLWDALSLEDVRDLVWDPQQGRQGATSAVRECVSLAVRRWTHGLEEPSAGVPDIACAIASFFGDGNKARFAAGGAEKPPLGAADRTGLVSSLRQSKSTTGKPPARQALTARLERQAKPDM